MSNRREARERVMQALYAHELSTDDAAHLIENLLDPELKDDRVNLNFAKALLIRTLEHRDELDQIIRDHAKNWELGRIALIDRILLRMALCEFLHFQDIPPKVSINEAIEVAKRYSTSKSGQFINGVLDAVLSELAEAGRLQKTGRGLIEEGPSHRKSNPSR
jgi:transcription antitermination protein NusB